MPEFFAPLPLGAVVLMVVNDRVLKARFHNAVTGKLSDLAICFFLPLFCSALLGIVWQSHSRLRLVLGASLAAFVFTAREIWIGFQVPFLALLRKLGGPLGLGHFTLTMDWSDLWALLMVPLAVGYGWRRLGRPPETATSAPESRHTKSRN